MNFEDLQQVEDEGISKEAKRLFDKADAVTKTELEENDIKLLMRLQFYERLTRTGIITKLIDDFLVMRISKNRQSRKEFVDALRSSLLQETRLNSLERFIGVQK